MLKRWLAGVLIMTLVAAAGPGVPGARAEAGPAVGADPAALTAAIGRATGWLTAAQHPEGWWGADPRLAVRDTATVLEALDAAGDAGPAGAAAQNWLAAAATPNSDALARQIAAVSPRQELAEALATLRSRRGGDDGWGPAPGYASDPLDSALSLQALATAAVALAAANPADTRLADLRGEIAASATTLADLQNADGSWGLFPGATGTVYVTATTLLALRDAAGAGATVAGDRFRRGAGWLLAHRSADGTWGTGRNAGLTALAYRAVLQGAAVTKAGPVPGWLLTAQDAAGSWDGQPAATAEVIKTLALAARLPDLRLGTVALLGQSAGGPVPSDSFAAYQTVLVDPGAPVTGVVTEAVVQGAASGSPAGAASGSFQPADNGLLTWNTQASPPGGYEAVVLLRDTATSLVLDEVALPFTVTPTLGVRSLSVMLSPARTGLNQSVSPQVIGELVNGSNISGAVTLTAQVSSAAGTVVAEQSREVALTPGSDPMLPPLLQFTPDVSVAQDYTVTLTAAAGGTTLAQASNQFRVLPAPEPVRIDVTKTVSPTRVLPGDATVGTAISLKGIGTVDDLPRAPIDMVFTIDNSGSMEWGDIPYQYPHPNRSEAAKSASKGMVDLLAPTDRGALVTFGYSWNSGVRQGLTSNKTLLKQRIDQYVYPWGSTAIGYGIRLARNHLATYSPAANQKVIILLTDGEETDWPKSSVQAEADAAFRQGITIYTIGLGGTADKAFLTDLAQRTGGYFVFSPAIDDLQQIMEELGRAITQVAGKDVRLTDTLPAGVEVVPGSITPAPYSVTTQNGQTVVEWRFPQMAINEIQNLAFNLNLHDLQGGSTVEVNHSLQLTYTNNAGQPVTVTLDPYTVEVAADRLESSLTLDKAEYAANEPMQVTARVANTGAAPLHPQAVIDVVDGNDRVVATLLTQELSLAAGAAETLQAAWNTGTTFAGPYRVRLRLTEAGLRLGGSDQPFAVLPDGGPTLASRTDKSEYDPGESVNVTSVTVNASLNAARTGLSVLTEIAAPDGTVLLSEEQPLPELTPGARTATAALWASGQAAPGLYGVQTVLRQGSVAVAQQQLAFTIRSSADTGAGLSGTLSAAPLRTLPSGDITFDYQVTNGGNAATDGATLRLIVGDPVSGTALATLEAPLAVAAGGTAAGQLPYRFDDLQTGSYLASLQAVLANGTVLPLASSGFTAVQPFSLTAAIDPTVQRVLVWGAPGPGLDRVTAALAAQGAYYRVVASAAAFQAELRSGLYGVVLVAGGWPDELAASDPNATTPAAGLDHLDWELREKVYGGTGLILFAPANAPQLVDEQQKPGSWLGAKSGSPEQLLYSTLGQGHTLWLDFDPAAADPAAVDRLLAQAVPGVANSEQRPAAMGAVTLTFRITGGELPASARVQVALSTGAAVLAAPGATMLEGLPTYAFDLAPGEQRSGTLFLQLPDAKGSFPVGFTGSYLAHETYHAYATATVELQVTADGADLLGAVRAGLPAGATAAERNLIRNLTRTLDGLAQQPPATPQQLDQAIHSLLQDLRRLDGLKGETAAVHLGYVKLIGYYQARWSQGR